MSQLKLIATPLSHFARKARLLLDLYEADYEFVDIVSVIETDTKHFAGNPLMKVPILSDGENWLIESDYIAAYIVKKLDQSDRYNVETQNLFDLNARAVMNGIMADEAKYILARRMKTPVEDSAYFSKALKSISEGMGWLEDNSNKFDSKNFKYKELHLYCLWQHLEYYQLVEMNYPGLQKIIQTLDQNPVLNKTAPLVLKPK